MKQLTQIIIIFVVSLSIANCGNVDKVEIVKTYNDNGSLQSIAFVNQDKEIDSSIYYAGDKISKKLYYNATGDTVFAKVYQDHILVSEGFHSKGKKVRKWKYYKDGKVEKIYEYITICGEQYTNQGWVYDMENKIESLNSNYYTFLNLKESYEVNEPITFEIKYNPIIRQSRSVLSISPLITDDFCNYKTVPLDTIPSDNHKFEINLKFDSPTEGDLKGYIKEYGYKNNEYVERDLFVQIPLKIK